MNEGEKPEKWMVYGKKPETQTAPPMKVVQFTPIEDQDLEMWKKRVEEILRGERSELSKGVLVWEDEGGDIFLMPSGGILVSQVVGMMELAKTYVMWSHVNESHS